jgi:GAF domain-containing protein
VYVSDIATDPLWDDYRHLAQPHGLLSCWSTPIWGPARSVLGTVAIYRRTIGRPTAEEIHAIDMITEHVSEAILLARKSATRRPAHRPILSVIDEGTSDKRSEPSSLDRLLGLLSRLETKAAELDGMAACSGTDGSHQALHIAADQCRELASILRRDLRRLGGQD